MPYKYNPFSHKLDIVETAIIPVGTVVSLTGDTGGAVGPDGSGNINLDALYTNSIVGTPGSHVLKVTPSARGYPVTPYVVGPATYAGYQTIQSALDAANAAGGGIVYVQPGVYTESLTLYGTTEITGVPGNSDLVTAGNTVRIIGVHTPATTGSFTFSNVSLESPTDIFFSNAAGSASLFILNCSINCTNGYTFDLPNWTGTLIVYNVGEASTTNGVVNNTAGSTLFFISGTMGAGSSKSMISSGTAILEEIDLNCPWNAQTGTIVSCSYVALTKTLTLSNNSSGSINFGRFSTGSSAAITQSSSGSITLSNVVIDSSANPVISGAGAGAVKIGSVTYLSGSSISGTVTTSYTTELETGTAYLQNVSFDRGATTVSTNGQLIIGKTGSNPVIGTLTPGTGIIVTNGSGKITIAANGSLGTWTDVGASQLVASNANYFVTANVTLTLPDNPVQGDVVKVYVSTGGSLVVKANTGQIIRFGNQASSAAGTMTSVSGAGDALELVYRSANTTWNAISGVGAWGAA